MNAKRGITTKIQEMQFEDKGDEEGYNDEVIGEQGDVRCGQSWGR
jgi:hypothetical protein